jgi:hypothetical protein
VRTASDSTSSSLPANQVHLFCVGAAKTGTHSIGHMFDSSVRAYHEAGAGEIIPLIISPLDEKERKMRLLQCIRERDGLISPEVDSSQLNFFMIDVLLSEYPEARFLLTIRDCHAWLNSFINHSLRFPDTAPLWRQFRDFRFGANRLTHPSEEEPLRQLGLYTLEGYLSYWASHNKGVIDAIPSDRLLIVRTDEISDRAEEIAEFAGLPPHSINRDSLHVFKSEVDFRVLHQLPTSYLEAMVERFCGSLMARFFPGIKSLVDAGL